MDQTERLIASHMWRAAKIIHQVTEPKADPRHPSIVLKSLDQAEIHLLSVLKHMVSLRAKWHEKP
jgi:hypothetical protein